MHQNSILFSSSHELPLAAEVSELLLRARYLEETGTEVAWLDKENARLLYAMAVIRYHLSFISNKKCTGVEIRCAREQCLRK